MKFPSEEEIRSRLVTQVLNARKRKSWTQQALAARAKVPRSYIADLEGARRNPSLRILLRISNTLGMPVHQLFLESTDCPPKT